MVRKKDDTRPAKTRAEAGTALVPTTGAKTGNFVKFAIDPTSTTHDLRMAHARSVLAKVRAGRSTFRTVAALLGIPVDGLPDDRAGRSLAVYRAYVGGVVRTASPLLLRICELNGIDLDDLVSNLRPGMAWDQWVCGVRPHDVWARSLIGQVNAPEATAAMREEWALQQWLHGAWPVIYGEERRLQFGVRVLDAGLEMAAFPGGHRLRTHGSEGSITLGMELPDTLMAALPGVALDRFIDHPLINGAGCVVTGVDEPSLRWGTKVRFALDPVPWRMPWTRVSRADDR